MSDDVGLKKTVAAPYSLFPSVVPASVLNQAKDSMVHFSRLMHKVALDHDFLEASLKKLVPIDFLKQSRSSETVNNTVTVFFLFNFVIILQCYKS